MNQVKGSGASSTLFQHDRPNKVKVSRFDLSRKVNFSLDTGMIVPIDLIEVLPGDKFDISLKMALDTLPLVAPSLTNYKITTHWYFMKKRDLWKGWKTFITKGRSGNINLTVPKVDLSISNNGVLPISHHSLSAFLGVPPTVSGYYIDGVLNKDYEPFSISSSTQSTGLNSINQVSALPFVMYQSIVKHNYVNQNLLQDNKALFPDEGNDDWLLPFSVGTGSSDVVGIANFIDGSSSFNNKVVNSSGVFSSSENAVDLRLLRYAMYDDDYFTTALPWLQRGDIQTLDGSVVIPSGQTLGVELLGDNVPINFNDGSLVVRGFSDSAWSDWSDALSVGNGTTVSGNGFDVISSKYWLKGQPSDKSVPIKNSNSGTFSGQYYQSQYLGVNPSGLVANTSLTANQLRNLIAMSVWQERNARTDGSYNRMIFQHWTSNPKSEEHLPIYIGGTVDYLNFSTIIQNSESTSSSPLGSTAGFGSSSGEGSVCNSYVADDHGYIMGVMIIRPETVYEQGIDKVLTEFSFEDFPQPEFEGLSPQPILNKEIYISDNNEDNDDLFAYQERYTYLKVRQNINRGLMQSVPDKDLLFSAYTQARYFSTLPKFSYQFLCMSPDNVRRDWLAYPVYPAFRCQLLSNVFVTRALSYMAEPETFGF